MDFARVRQSHKTHPLYKLLSHPPRRKTLPSDFGESGRPTTKKHAFTLVPNDFRLFFSAKCPAAWHLGSLPCCGGGGPSAVGELITRLINARCDTCGLKPDVSRNRFRAEFIVLGVFGRGPRRAADARISHVDALGLLRGRPQQVHPVLVSLQSDCWPSRCGSQWRPGGPAGTSSAWSRGAWARRAETEQDGAGRQGSFVAGDSDGP